MSSGTSSHAPSKVKLSACLMVKNEHNNLPRCLKSLKNFVDEIVVVDTGSEDDTVEIAESFGARVFHHPWENDFAKHRNQSISYATGDWVFIVDADEELDWSENPCHAIRELFDKATENHDAMAITAKDVQKGKVVMQFHTTRLFRNGLIHYEGVVHNQPVVKGGRAVLFPALVVRHYGYDLTPEQKSLKAKRTVSLLRERLEKNPNDHSCYFYLSQIYADMGDRRGCTIYGEKYLAFRTQLNGQFNKSVYYTVAHAYMKLGDKAKAGQWIMEGVKDLPDDLDMSLCQVEYGRWVCSETLVVTGAKKFLKLYEAYRQDPMLKGNRFVYSFTPEAYCVCAFEVLRHQTSVVRNTIDGMKQYIDTAQPDFKEKMQIELHELLSKQGIELRSA